MKTLLLLLVAHFVDAFIQTLLIIVNILVLGCFFYSVHFSDDEMAEYSIHYGVWVVGITILAWMSRSHYWKMYERLEQRCYEKQFKRQQQLLLRFLLLKFPHKSKLLVIDGLNCLSQAYLAWQQKNGGGCDLHTAFIQKAKNIGDIYHYLVIIFTQADNDTKTSSMMLRCLDLELTLQMNIDSLKKSIGTPYFADAKFELANLVNLMECEVLIVAKRLYDITRKDVYLFESPKPSSAVEMMSIGDEFIRFISKLFSDKEKTCLFAM